MRIRSIKPDFWRSPDISCLDPVHRLLFIGLWSYVDDNGVGQDRPGVIAADLFADDLSRHPRETLARVSEGLSKLSEAGRIVRYTVAEREYLHITNWTSHQRIDKPNKARYPLPTSDNVVIRETLAESSRDPRETLAPGTGEQGNRGTVRENASRSLSAHAPASAPPARRAEPESERALAVIETIPEGWQPNERDRIFGTGKGVRDIDAAAERFRDHALATGRTCADWDAAFRNWLSSPRTRQNEPRAPGVGKPTEKARTAMSIADQLIEQNRKATE